MSETIYHVIETREEFEAFRQTRDLSQHRVGTFVVKPRELREALPRFIRVKGDRITRAWYFLGPDEDLIALYDYKETASYDQGAPSEEEFWGSEGDVQLSIGASYRDDAENETKVVSFIEYLTELVPGSRGLTEAAFGRQYSDWFDNQDDPDKEREMREFVRRWCLP